MSVAVLQSCHDSCPRSLTAICTRECCVTPLCDVTHHLLFLLLSTFCSRPFGTVRITSVSVCPLCQPNIESGLPCPVPSHLLLWFLLIVLVDVCVQSRGLSIHHESVWLFSCLPFLALVFIAVVCCHRQCTADTDHVLMALLCPHQFIVNSPVAPLSTICTRREHCCWSDTLLYLSLKAAW